MGLAVRSGRFQFSDADIAKMHQLREYGLYYDLIGKQFNCSGTRIKQLMGVVKNYHHGKKAKCK